MKTVVLFMRTGTNESGEAWKNRLWTRTLRKIGFIDNRYTGAARPQADEHWLVEVVRENQSAKGGCLILHPLRKIEKHERVPLVHGMYDMRMEEDVLVLVPHDKTKFWVISSEAKSAILSATKANTIIIDHGGSLWTKRPSAESVLEREAKKLLE